MKPIPQASRHPGGAPPSPRRRALTFAIGTAAVLPQQTRAQQAGRSYRLGVLDMGQERASAGEMDVFVNELARLGFVEGTNLSIDRRFAGSDRKRLDGLASELVALKPDVVFTAAGRLGALAAMKATSTIPIVFDATNDPVASGLVASLSRPGGNVTGTALFGLSLEPKRLQLLVEAVGKPMSIAHFEEAIREERKREMLAMLPSLGLASRARMQFVTVEKAEELEGAFERMSRDKVDALIVGSSAFTAATAERIAALIAQYRLPAIAEGRHYAERGVLVTYSTNFADVYRRGADYVAKILNGARPADLPIERASKFDLVINLKTAKALGLRIPQSLLIRADAIIQ